MSYWSPMIFHKFYCLKFIFNLNKLIFQIFGKSRFGGPRRSRGPQILTKHPIGLKIVPNWQGWTLVNLHITHACLFNELLFFIVIMVSRVNNGGKAEFIKDNICPGSYFWPKMSGLIISSNNFKIMVRFSIISLYLLIESS